MVTRRELYNFFDALYPKSLSCEWDNDGLMCSVNPEREVKRVLVTLDITNAVIEYAKEQGFDTVISHHPLIFKGVKELNTDNGVSARLINLAVSDIAAMSFHTRLDAGDGGVNDALAKILELSNIEKFGDGGLGRIGELPFEMTAEKLAHFIKEKLNAPIVSYNGAKDRIRRLAVLGGAGSDEIHEAASVGADAYLTGELSHHDLTDAADTKITLFAAGHHSTEFPVCAGIKRAILEHFPTVEVEIFDSLNIKYV